MSDGARNAVGYVLLVAIGLGYEVALVALARRPLLLTWPLALIGCRLNTRAAVKSLRLLNDCSSCADVCIAFSGLYTAARRRR